MNTLEENKGSVLILALVLLIILTTLAVTEMSMNTTQTRTATYAADQQVAFQTAEAALNEALTNLATGVHSNADFLSKGKGLYIYNPTAANLWTTVNWNSADATVKSFKGASNKQSGYIIEQLPSIIKGGQNMNVPVNVYRITVRAEGTGSNSVVIIQSTVQIQQ